MPEYSSEFWMQLLCWAVGFAAVYGRMTTRLSCIEKKIDALGIIGERVSAAEQNIKNSAGRMESLALEVRELRRHSA